MKKILFFINTISCGGAEKALVTAVKSLPKDKYKFTVVSITKENDAEELPDYVDYKVIIKTKNKFLRKLLGKIFYKILPKGLFGKLFLKGDFDIAVAYLEGFPTNVVSRLDNCKKKIAFLHCGVSEDVIARVYPTVKDCIDEYNRFSKICFVSEDAKRNFTRIVGELSNTEIVKNIIDVSDVLKQSEEDCENAYSTNGTKIVSVGRLNEIKGYSRLIDIASSLEKKYDFQINIIGDGELYKSLSQKIEDLNVKSVKLIGYKSNPYSYMKQADLYICSSFSEGYNTAVIEALLLDLPVITTSCPGMNEILHNGKYGVITENSTDSLKSGLEEMLREKSYTLYKSEVEKLDKKSFVGNAVEGYIKLFND